MRRVVLKSGAVFLLIVLLLSGNIRADWSVNRGSVNASRNYFAFANSALEECLDRFGDKNVAADKWLLEADADRYFERALVIDENNVRAQIGRGMNACFELDRSPEEALSLWADLGNFAGERSTRKNFYAGLAFLINEDLEGAELFLSRSLYSWRFVEAQSKRLAADGEMGRAVKWARMAVALNIRRDAVFQLAHLYQQIGEVNESIRVLESYLLTLEADSAEYWSVTGEIALLNNNQPLAKDALGKAASISKTPYPFLEKLGRLELAAGNFQEAINYFETAIDIRPDYQYGYIFAADVQLALGEINDARRYYQKAVELAPHDQVAQTRLGTVEYDLGNDTIALEHLEKALAQNPLNPTALYLSAEILHANAKHEEAIIKLESALSVSPSPQGWQLLGDWYKGIGNVESALEAYEQAASMRE